MERIRLKEKIAYGFGDAASSMLWKLFGMYLLFFYTDIFGISAAAAGTMFLITRIWDSVIDPVVGVMADRTVSRYGRFRPYLLYWAVPFGVMGVLTFTTPGFGAAGKLVYAYVTYSIMMLVYSLVNVPYASLLGVISPDPRDRMSLSSFRMSFAFAGSIVVIAIIQPLVGFFTRVSGSVQGGWSLSLVVVAILVITLLLLAFAWTRERVEPVSGGNNPLKEDLKDLLHNRPWWILLLASIGALVFNSLRDGAAIYYFKYVFSKGAFVGMWAGLEKGIVPVYLIVGQVANIIGIVAVTPASNRIGKKTVFGTLMAIAGILSVGFLFVPDNSVGWVLAMQFFISICAGGVFPLLWSMYADTVDYSELRSSRRANGLIFSASSMSQKLGWTLGGALTGWLLSAYGFEANEAVAVHTQTGIKYIMSLFSAMGCFLACFAMILYPLGMDRMKEIVSRLNTLRHGQ